MEEASQEESEEDSDWDGISDGEADGVQVVEHTDALSRMAAMSKEELKSFMVFLRNGQYTIRANEVDRAQRSRRLLLLYRFETLLEAR